MIKKEIAPEPGKLDFERWSRMAKDNPNLFEAMRRQAIDDVIAKAPEDHQQRLRCLQWRIDQERRLAKNPLNACIRISRMMWESVAAPGGLLDSLKRLEPVAEGNEARISSLTPADIIPFRTAGN